MKKIIKQRERIINIKATKAYPQGEEIAILRKAIADLAAGNPLSQEFIDYNATINTLKSEV